MHYVIGDVHGCYTEMKLLLDKIESNDPDATIIFVGDFIDRGPEVWKVLTWMMEHVTPEGKYQSVRGNHEDMILKWYKEWKIWWREGGFSQRNSLMPETEYDFSKWLDGMNYLSPEKLEPIIDFFEALPYNKAVPIRTKSGNEIMYRIVHAWMFPTNKVSEEDQKYYNLWLGEYGGNPDSDEIIVHGHTPTISMDFWDDIFDAPGMIDYKKNAINLDGGCCYKYAYNWFPCMLCGICLETLEEFYPYTLEERMKEIAKEETEAEYQERIGLYKECFMGKENKHRREMRERLEVISS